MGHRDYPSCGRTTNPNIVLSIRLDSDIIMATGGSEDHWDQHDSSSFMALRYQHGAGGNPDPWHQHGF